jgi:universal stress protein E
MREAGNAMANKTILAVIDPTSAAPTPVVERAASLAERAGAALELFASDYDADIDAGRVSSVRIPDAGAREHRLARHRGRLEELAAPLRARGLAVSVEVAWDCPVGDAIVRRVQRAAPWLVAKDTHHLNVIARTILSNTDWHLIRDCPAPLLLVKGRPIAARPKVLAALDPLNEHDRPAVLDGRIFELARGLASDAGGELHVVHACAMPMGLQLPPAARDMIMQEHRAAMTRFVADHPVPAERVHLLEGLAHECIERAAADTAADFVVMGAVARRGMSRIFIGSTAERVLDKLPCDLVIVKPADFVAPSQAR